MPSDHAPLPKLAFRFRRFLEELDVREGYVAGHSAAVCKTSLRLARSLDIPSRELPALALGALMHDIGKVFLDESLLGKESPLTPEEHETIRLHPELGEALLAPSVPDATVLGIVRWHHERWDGQGYPDGLRGPGIPLAARIVAAADAFTAMCESRAYRPARNPEETVEEMVRLGGRQFDETCVEALVETVAEACSSPLFACRTMRQGVQAV